MVRWLQIQPCKGKQFGSRRCSKCGYRESVTANTLFHKLKIDILTAFNMLYEICLSKKGANSIWLAERFRIQKKPLGISAQSFRELWLVVKPIH